MGGRRECFGVQQAWDQSLQLAKSFVSFGTQPLRNLDSHLQNGNDNNASLDCQEDEKNLDKNSIIRTIYNFDEREVFSFF